MAYHSFFLFWRGRGNFRESNQAHSTGTHNPAAKAHVRLALLSNSCSCAPLPCSLHLTHNIAFVPDYTQPLCCLKTADEDSHSPPSSQRQSTIATALASSSAMAHLPAGRRLRREGERLEYQVLFCSRHVRKQPTHQSSLPTTRLHTFFLSILPSLSSSHRYATKTRRNTHTRTSEEPLHLFLSLPCPRCHVIARQQCITTCHAPFHKQKRSQGEVRVREVRATLWPGFKRSGTIPFSLSRVAGGHAFLNHQHPGIDVCTCHEL